MDEITLQNSSNGSDLVVSTSCSPYESVEFAYVALASAISASVSFFASLFIIFIIIYFRKWKFVGQRLILYLAISSLLASISTMVHRVDYHNQVSSFYTNFCIFGGFFEQLTSWMVLSSITSITTYMFILVTLQTDAKKLEVAYILLIFVLPVAISLIPFVQLSYGRSGAWCWIRNEERFTCENYALGEYFIFALWFIPVHVLLAALLIMYIIILVCMRINRDHNNPWKKKIPLEVRKENRAIAIRLIAYPFIYLVLSCFPLMNRIQNEVERGQPRLVFWYMAAIAFPLAGGLIGLAYTLDPETRKKLTRAHFKAALREWRREGDCEEYPVNLEREESVSYTHFSSSEMPVRTGP